LAATGHGVVMIIDGVANLRNMELMGGVGLVGLVGQGVAIVGVIRH